jgi:hypothetical protein
MCVHEFIQHRFANKLERVLRLRLRIPAIERAPIEYSSEGRSRGCNNL